MSYDVTIVDKSGEAIYVDEPHGLIGGTYSPTSRELWVNITFNYAKIFNREDVFGEGGIKNLIGMSVEEALPIVTKAASVLKEDYAEDYWTPTEGNVKKSLMNLISLMKLAPNDGIIEIGY